MSPHVGKRIIVTKAPRGVAADVHVSPLVIVVGPVIAVVVTSRHGGHIVFIKGGCVRLGALLVDAAKFVYGNTKRGW